MTHYLNVVDVGDGELERTVEHDFDCEEKMVYTGEIGYPFQDVWDWNCGLGNWMSWYGLDELADDPRFNIPGRHEIAFYYSTPMSSSEDPEAYLYYVDEVVEDVIQSQEGETK